MAFRVPLSSRNADTSASQKPGGKNLKSKVPLIDRATLCSTLQLISDNYAARATQVKITEEDISKPTVSTASYPIGPAIDMHLGRESPADIPDAIECAV